jgi:pimeloyl-ACP methyl ester carboxylesterase
VAREILVSSDAERGGRFGHRLGGVIEVRDFTVDVTDAQIKDLRERLARARLPEAETVDDWSQGIPLAYLRELAEYWARDYDMSRVATRLNALPQFHAAIDELGVHFLHIRSPHAQARPLIMTHGWPGSVLEFLNVIGPLTDPPAHGGPAEDAFHLVIPALPGYGFSDKPSRPGTGVARIAAAWHQLMGHLGYPEYYAQGGDWGAAVTGAMGVQRPEGLLGIHVNMALTSPAALLELGDPTPEEHRMLAKLKRFRDHGSGYSTQQRTRPQTLGYGLTDSPTGQLAWIVEKFYAWTDCQGHPENALSRDEMLDNVTLYWLTNTATSSARLYWESFGSQAADEVAVPSAYSLFPEELFLVSERWLRTRFTDLRYYHQTERGGHFAAFEQPEIFVREVRDGIRALL